MRPIIALSRYALVLALVPFLPAQGSAYQPSQPFGQLDIGIQGAININRIELHHYWKSHPSLQVTAVTPFYFGIAMAGLQAHSFSALNKGVFDFTSFFVYLGWGAGLPLARHVEWQTTLNLGNYVMLFTNPNSENNDESELGAGITSQMKYRFHSRWSLNVSGSYNLIFTRKRIHLAFISMGLNYRLDTPGWLRKFLE